MAYIGQEPGQGQAERGGSAGAVDSNYDWQPPTEFPEWNKTI